MDTHHYAVAYDQKHMVTKLLDEGADIDAQDPLGNTALMLAIEYQKVNMVELLINNGARTDIINQRGETIADIAEKRLAIKWF